MRFKELGGLTGLPVEAIRHAYSGEDVRSVLPVSIDGDGSEAVLVATGAALAVVTGEEGPQGSRWLTRWAPWGVVHISGSSDSRLTVQAGPLTFVPSLSGEEGRQALGDFLRVAPAGVAATTG